MKTVLKSLFLLLVISFFSTEILAQTKLSVQGVIRLADGNAIEDGLYPITFKLYDTIVGGNLLWTEIQPQLKVTSGIYSTILGEVEPLDLQFNEFYYLSLTVEGEELLPRAPLTSAPYSNSVLGFDNVFPSTGNVGVGTLTPSSELDIEGEIEISGSRIHVDSDGDVGIGTSNPKDGSFHINKNEIIFTDSIGDTPYFKFRSNGGEEFIMAYLASGGSHLMAMYSLNGPLKFGAYGDGNMIYLGNNGHVGIKNNLPNVELDVGGSIEYTGTITDVSDRRLKENLSSVTNVLPKLEKLDAFTYNMIDDPKKEREFGLMAQDVQKVFPEMVSIVDSENGYLGVSYIQLVPVLVQANKELQKENDDLQKADLEMQKLIKSLQEKNKKFSQTLNAQTEISNARMSVLESKLNQVLEQQSVSKL